MDEYAEDQKGKKMSCIAWVFKVYRDCDALRLRKVVIELYDENGELLDRRRLFGILFSKSLYKKRLLRKQNKMLSLAEVNKTYSYSVETEIKH